MIPHGFIPIIKAFSLLTLSIVVGISGYKLIEDFTLLESFYMTVITLSTVGFKEVKELSDSGRLFTGFYIILNLGIFAYVVSVITTYLFEGEINKIYKNLMIGREVKKMKDHIIVCGFGRNGQKACEELLRHKRKFVLVEMDDELIASSSEINKYQLIRGNATLDETLIDAGIQRARCVITTLPRDSDNVFISLTAKELNPEIFVIARASEENSSNKLHRAGADKVVMPDALGGVHMAQLVIKPYVIEFLDLLNGVGDIENEEKLILEDFSFKELKEESRNKTLKELNVRNRTGAFIMAIKNGNSGFKFNPGPEIILKEKEILIVLGNQNSINTFKKTFGK